MTTALDPSASPHCVFGADGRLRCADQDGPVGMWGPRTDPYSPEARVRAAQVEAERQQAVLERQWQWERQQSAVAAQEHGKLQRQQQPQQQQQQRPPVEFW